MSGFFISTGPAGSFVPRTNPKTGDWLREHRFRINEFFNIMGKDDIRQDFLVLKDVSLPDKEISDIAIKTPGTTYRFASQVGYSDLSMTFYASLNFLNEILRLHESVHSISEGLKDHNVYKGKVSLALVYEPHRPFVQAFVNDNIFYDYKNAWISKVTHGNLTYTSSDIKTITVNIKFDFFEVRSGYSNEIVKNSVDG